MFTVIYIAVVYLCVVSLFYVNIDLNVFCRCNTLGNIQKIKQNQYAVTVEHISAVVLYL